MGEHVESGTSLWGATELLDYIDEFRVLSPEDIVERGFTVQGTFDEVDDPVLIGPDGVPVDTWREGYPYDERMSRHDYDETKRLLQIEFLSCRHGSRRLATSW